MKFKIYQFACTVILLLILQSSCNKNHTKDEIEQAMQQYNHLIKKMDADSIALLFTPNGDLGDMAHGRSWIKRFLSTFTNVKVLSQNSITSSIVLTGDSALQKGSYTQVVILLPQDTTTIKGDYIARWVWDKQSGWLLRSINTTPKN
jgi:hypothetical protein